MTALNWKEVSDLFGRVIDLPEPERGPELDRLCTDESVKLEVRELLAADAKAESHFAPSDRYRRLLGADTPAPGMKLGAWRLEREIARGGMGSVWLARRADGHFDKRVAVKLVGAGAADAHLASRFVNERHIVAGLEHPGIVSVIDGGSDEGGRPYLVMEYIDGSPIDRFVTENHRGVEDRVRLIAQLCDIVQFVHDQRILHRDLKPSNVLVSNEGRVHLIDFGIAKRYGEDAKVELTATHMRPLTPRYASPEQFSTGVADPRSDVYSIGVMLYELLVGESPYGPNPDSTTLELLIREYDPPRPSTVARRRARSGSADISIPSRDLDTIVAKALAKDPARRYQTAAEFGADLRRVLEHRPIHARPPSLAYRFLRFARRRRAWVLTLGVVALAGASILHLQRRNDAERNSNEAERAAAAYKLALRAAARSIDSGESLFAKRALNSIPSALRAFEWRHLSLLADSSRHMLYRYEEHDARYPIVARPLDPFGDRIVAACSCPPYLPFLVLDGATGSVVATRPVAERATIEIRSGHDGRLAVGIVSDTFILPGTAWIWGIEDPALDRRLCDDVSAVAWSLDGSSCFVGTSQGELVAYRTDGTEAARSRPHESPVKDIEPSPSRALLATSSFDETIALLDPTTLEVRARWSGHTMQVEDAAFRPDGARLASISLDRSLRVWDCEEGRETMLLRDLLGMPACVIWPVLDGPIYVGFDDGAIREYDEDSGQVIRTWLGCSYPVESIEYVVDRAGSRRLVVGDREQSIRSFDLDRPPVRELVTCEYSPVLAFDRFGKRLVSPGPDGAIRVFDVETGRAIAELRLDEVAPPNVGNQAVTDACFASDGRTIVASHKTGSVSIFDAESFRLLHAFRDLGAAICGVAQHPTLPLIVALDALGRVHAIDPRDGSAPFRIADTDDAISETKLGIDFTPDGRWLVILRGRTLSWHDPASGRRVGGIDDPTRWPRRFEIAPDSRRVALRHDAGVVEILDLETTRVDLRIETLDGEGWAMAIHPTEPRIALGTPSGTIQIHDLTTGESLLSLRGLRGAVNDIEFSPDGSMLAATGMSGHLRILRSASR